jgi:sulfatase modifying factor 1
MRRLQFVGLFLFLGLFVGVVGLYGQDGQKNIKRERGDGNKWALLIGVDDYAHVNKLESCGQDMRALRERLLASDFPERQVFLLHDKADVNKYRPFKGSIEAQLDLLLGQVDDKGKSVSAGLVDKEDLVVVAFSGHGVLLDGVSYLCPVETRLGKPETLVSLDGIYNRLSACRASQKLLVVDACRNDPRPGGQKGPRTTDETQGFARSLEKPPEGILVLASCSPGQVSWEDAKQLGHGVFMNFVLKGLSGEARDKDGEVTMLGLYKYASKETKLYVAHAYGEVQTPELFGKVQGDFAIGPVATAPALPDCTGEKGRTAAEVKAAQQAWAKYLGRQVEEEDDIGGVKMKFVLVPPGKFLMGSPKAEIDDVLRQFPDAKRKWFQGEVQHEVTITQPFYLGKTEVTQAQYEALGKENKSRFKGADLPLETVKWDEADAFARELTQKKAGAKLLYRLPTEAEWEYSCRGGRSSSSPFGIGDGISLLPNQANFNEKYPYDSAAQGTFLAKTCRVGSYPANALGLYDMHGNVWEYCSDWHGDYPTGKVTDPTGPEKGSHRVARGGSWLDYAWGCRAAFRGWDEPTIRFDLVGFRLARVPSGK